MENCTPAVRGVFGALIHRGQLLTRPIQCFDNKGANVATWERGQLEDDWDARLTIKHAGLGVVTEILTTLTLNRIAHKLSW